MRTYREERFTTFWEEAKDLYQSHAEEINLFNAPLDIFYDLYEELEADGVYKLYTIRDEERLIGYAGFFLFFHPHHKTSLQAKQDILFITKEYRGKGLPFLKHCDQELQELGVELVHHCVPASNDWGKILERIGYKKLESIYTRRL